MRLSIEARISSWAVLGIITAGLVAIGMATGFSDDAPKPPAVPRSAPGTARPSAAPAVRTPNAAVGNRVDGLQYFAQHNRRARGFAEANPSVVYLDVHDRTFRQLTLASGTLFREIPRQALLMAAREELGLATRDAALREIFPWSPMPTQWPLSVVTAVTLDFKSITSVIRYTSEGVQVLWSVEHELGEEYPYQTLTAIMEQNSRSEFVELLRREGFTGTANRKSEEDSIPDEVASLLEEWNDISQFAAVRRLHQLIRSSGESPARLAGLARGYANLGVLTASYYSTMHKAYMARALLYAERLGHAAPETPQFHWTRAYVKGLIGLPESALDDITAAGKLEGKPFEAAWCGALEDYCRGNETALAARRDVPDEAPLACYLTLMTACHRHDEQLRFAAVTKFVETVPDCLRAMHLVWFMRNLGMTRYSQTTVQRLSDIVQRRMQAVGDLPPHVQEMIEEPFRDDPKKIELLAMSLKSSGRPPHDISEPSLDALGQLVSEAAFASTFQYMYYLNNQLGVSIQEEVNRLSPYLTGHPYKQVVTAMAARGAEREGIARRWELNVNINELEPATTELLIPLQGTLRSAGDLSRSAWEHADYTVFEIGIRLYNQTHAPRWPELRRHLKRINPRSLMTIEQRIRLEPEESRPEFPAWEERFADNGSIQHALSEEYMKRGEVADAERCLLRRIQIQPTYSAYQDLAKIAKARGDEEAWKDALEESLSYPVTGLHHTTTRKTLAEYFLARDDLEQAAAYADDAAESGAGWAMTFAARVHHRLENWGKAESYYEATARRYAGSAFDWYLWCRQNGRGDIEAALKLADERLANLAGEISDSDLVNAALVYLMTDRLAESLKLFSDAARRYQHPHFAWYAYVLADAEGDTKLTDEMMTILVESERGGEIADVAGASPIARHIRDLAANKTQPPDLVLIDEHLARLPPAGATHVCVFLGLLFQQWDQPEIAERFLLRAAASPHTAHYSQAVALWALKSAGADVELRSGDEFLLPATPPNAAQAKLLIHSAEVRGIAKLEGNDQFWTWDADGNLRVWKGESLIEQDVQRFDDVKTNVMAATSDVSLVATTSVAGDLKIWRPGDSQPQQTLPRVGAELGGAVFLKGNPQRLVRFDIKYKLEQAPSGTVGLWDLSRTAATWEAPLDGIHPTGMVTVPKDNAVCVFGWKSRDTGWIGLLSLDDGRILRELDVPRNRIIAGTRAAAAPTAATLSQSGELILWDLQTLAPRRRFWPRNATAIALSPDAKLLAAGRSNGELAIFDLENNRLAALSQDHLQSITSVQFLSDGNRLATTSRDFTARVWELDRLRTITDVKDIHEHGPLFVHSNSMGMPFAPVPAGEFVMGERQRFEHPRGYRSNNSDLIAARPRHPVILNGPYYMGQFEVTVGDFRRFVEETGHVTYAEGAGRGSRHFVEPTAARQVVPGLSWRNPGFEQDDHHPVVHVSYDDALAFCRWLSEKESAVYRLPTEAEWERACRGGTDTSWFYGNYGQPGDIAHANLADVAIRKRYDFYGVASTLVDDGYPFSSPAGSFPSNGYGLYDMHGNAFEWCSDFYHAKYYASSPQIDPKGPETGKEYVQRGGSFLTHADDSRSAHRDYDEPNITWSNVGFRIVKEIPVAQQP